MKANCWALTVLAVFVVATSVATEFPKMNIEKTSEKKVLLTYEASSAFPLEISICSEEGKMLYYWKTNSPKNQISQLLNLQKYNCGTYNICLNYGGRSINRKLQLTENRIIIGPAQHYFEPFFEFENEQLKVSFLNMAQKNVYVNIFKEGECIAAVRLGNNMDIQKSLNFSKLEKGDYKVVLSDHFKDHNYWVEK